MREHRVIGPPGTGKTEYLSRQAERAAGRYGKRSVAIVALTKAAAEEIGDRASLPDGNVGTLHSFAFRALGKPALAEVPEGIKEWNRRMEDRGPNLRIIRTHGSPDQDAPLEAPAAATDGEKMLDALQIRRARREPQDRWPTNLRHFDALWRQFKHDTGRLDFTDLIEILVDRDPRLLGEDDDADPFEGPGVAGVMPGAPVVLMVDEAQDLSRLEFALVRLWGRKCHELVVVGDDWQNLYEWRGTEPDAFAGATVATETVLSQSYRVPARVLDYARAWCVDHIPERKFPDYNPRVNGDGQPVIGDVRELDCRLRSPLPLVRAIADDLDELPDEPGVPAVMVLASCTYMIRPIVRALREHGVAFHNPYRNAQGEWNPMRAANRLLAFLRPNPDVWGNEHRLWTWNDLRLWADPLTARGVYKHGSKTFVESQCVEDRFGEDQGEREVPLATLERLLEPAAMEAAMFHDVDWWRSRLRAKTKDRFSYALQVYAVHGGRALRDRPRVVVGTIHSVKGAQAQSVYVFPDLSHRGYWRNWHLPSGRPSTVRLFYVAFTRARERLTVCQPSGAEYAQLPRPTNTED